jgi:hypothetical protein
MDKHIPLADLRHLLPFRWLPFASIRTVMQMGQNLSPYLMRMNSSAIYYIPAQGNSAPTSISALLTPSSSSGIVGSVTAVNTGGAYLGE